MNDESPFEDDDPGGLGEQSHIMDMLETALENNEEPSQKTIANVLSGTMDIGIPKSVREYLITILRKKPRLTGTASRSRLDRPNVDTMFGVSLAERNKEIKLRYLELTKKPNASKTAAISQLLDEKITLKKCGKRLEYSTVEQIIKNTKIKRGNSNN